MATKAEILKQYAEALRKEIACENRLNAARREYETAMATRKGLETALLKADSTPSIGMAEVYLTAGRTVAQGLEAYANAIRPALEHVQRIGESMVPVRKAIAERLSANIAIGNSVRATLESANPVLTFGASDQLESPTTMTSLINVEEAPSAQLEGSGIQDPLPGFKRKRRMGAEALPAKILKWMADNPKDHGLVSMQVLSNAFPGESRLAISDAVRRLKDRGFVESLGRGLYQLKEVPQTAELEAPK